MEEVGVYLVGLYTGCNSYTRDDGSISWSVALATGRETYRVYLDREKIKDFNPEKDMQFGGNYTLRARPYINNRGFITWAGGEVLG